MTGFGPENRRQLELAELSPEAGETALGCSSGTSQNLRTKAVPLTGAGAPMASSSFARSAEVNKAVRWVCRLSFVLSVMALSSSLTTP